MERAACPAIGMAPWETFPGGLHARRLAVLRMAGYPAPKFPLHDPRSTFMCRSFHRHTPNRPPGGQTLARTRPAIPGVHWNQHWTKRIAALGVVLLILVLAGCGSSGKQAPVSRASADIAPGGRAVAMETAPNWSSIGSSIRGRFGGSTEEYQGQFAAALAPVQNSTPGLQQRLLTELETAGIFANVITIDSPLERNEAEIIIKPAVVDAQMRGNELQALSLGVRATVKGTGHIGLDQVYSGRSSRRGDALTEVMANLTRDLERNFGRPPLH